MQFSIVNANISKFNKLQLIPNLLSLNFLSFLKVLSFFYNPPPVIVTDFLMLPAKGSAGGVATTQTSENPHPFRGVPFPIRGSLHTCKVANSLAGAVGIKAEDTLAQRAKVAEAKPSERSFSGGKRA